MLRILQNGKELAINADHHIVLSSKQSIEIKNSNNKNLTSKIDGKDLVIYEEGSDIPLVTIEDYIDYIPDIYVSPFNLPFGEAITPLTLSSGISVATLGLGALALGGVGAAVGGGGSGSGSGNSINTAPEANDDVATVDEDSSDNTITVLTNDTDADGDTLSVTAASALHGTVSINSDGTLNYTPDADYSGEDTITYTLSDGELTDDTGTVTVTVTNINDAPEAVDDAITVKEGETFTSSVDLDSNDTDVDGDTLSVVAGTYTTTEGGTLVLASDGSYTYTPASGFAGTDTVDYTVTDGNLTDIGTLTINVSSSGDTAPVAVDDAIAVTQDTTFTSNVDLDSNDTDVDGDTLSVVAGTFTTTGGGTLVLASDGSYTYTPTSGFTGTDTVDYTLTDGNLTDTGTLSIEVFPPTTITIDSISEDTGVDATDFITSDNDGLTINATLSGALYGNEVLEYSNDGGKTWIDITSLVNGKEVSYVDDALTSTNTIMMRVIDTGGNAGTEDSQLITIDTTPPPAPTIDSYIDNIGPITSDASTETTTDDSYITLQGTVTNIQAGEVVNVYEDGTLLGTAIVSGNDWTYNAVLTDTSTHTYTVATVDAAGNTTAGTESLDVALNTMVQLEATGVTGSDDEHPQITAVGTSGEYVVTYSGRDSNDDYSIFVQKFSSDGTIQGDQVKLEAIGVTDGDDYVPQITALNDGAYVVTYSGRDSDGDRSIFVQKFSSDGTIQGDQVQLEATYYTGDYGSNASNPQITALNDGAYVVTYQGKDSDGDRSIFVQKFSSDGTIQGDQVKLEATDVTGGNDRNPQITALNDGAYVVTYHGQDNDGDYSIFVQKFDSDGTIQGEQVKLEATDVTNESDVYPQITELHDGAYVVTYYGQDNDGGDYSIFVQKFSSDGATEGDQVKLEVINPDYLPGDNPQITAVGENGEYVVTFYGRESDGGDYSVFVQKFDSDGATEGAQVKLEATDVTGGFDVAPQITAVGENGEYVVTYYGKDSGGDNSVFIQKFNSDGTIQGDQVKLEATGVTDKGDYAPQITAVGTSGAYVITFYGTDSNGDDSVFVQKFSSDGTIFIETDGPTITLDTISNDDYINATEAGSDLIITGTTKHIEDDQTVTVTLDGNTYTGTVSSNTFSITIPSTVIGALADGTTYSVEVSTEDIYGNSVNDTREIIFDTTAPTATVTIDNYIDNIGPITSDASTETTTDDSYITLQGTVTNIQAGEVVNVYEDGTLLGTAVVSGNDWTYNAVLTDTSTHTYTVATVDAAGNTTAGTGSLDVALNTMVQLEATGVTGSDDEHPQITAVGTSGEYVVTYSGRDSDGDDSVFVQKFSSNGVIQGDQVKLEATGVTGSDDEHPQITAVGTSGEYVVTYSGRDSDGDDSVFVQKFSSDGATEGDQVKLEATGVTSGFDTYPKITALNDGEYVVTYYGVDSDGDFSIFVQKFDSEGVTEGEQVRLEAISANLLPRDNLQITAVGTSGAYVVTYYGLESNGYDTSIFVQKFNSDGTTEGDRVKLEAIGANLPSSDSLQITAVGTSGAYVVTYYGVDSGGDFSIFVQKFSSDGTIQGDQVKLEATGVMNGDDYSPQITALNDGAYVVTYSGRDSDGDRSIFVQKFSSNGTIQGDQVKLEALGITDGSDKNPQVAAVGTSGEYVVTYQGVDSNGDTSVFVQKFNSDGTIFIETDSSSVGPVALDINGDGIITYEAAFMDINFDDILDTTAWVSGGDGILVWDEYGDGVLHDASQFAFGSNGLTDLEGLAALFDTNSDGIFDSNDTEFGNFGALVDGEIISLADLGITSIDLHSNQEMTNPFEGVTVHGDSTATLVDGTTMLIQDVAFDYEANGGV